jgi:hypothetical protein
MKMTESLNTIKDKVEDILKSFPQTRDSDKLLWLAYLVIHHDLKATLGDEAYNSFKAILLNDDTPTMESVRRVRQKLQESGQYVGEKRADRMKESESVREWSQT